METREAYLLRVGREEGRLEGRQTGREEGRLDAMRSMFVAQLRSKFSDVPAGVVARVEKADVDRLGRWSLRIVVAATLDEVFAE